MQNKSFNLKKGLDIPLVGAPELRIETPPPASRVALYAHEFHGLKPDMQVRPGDEVAQGQPLFSDRRYPEILYTSPASGVVEEVHRGRKRALLSVEVRVEGQRQVAFPAFDGSELMTLSPETVREQLLRSGLWTAFRTRPYSEVPPPTQEPDAIFITAMDTRPLSLDPAMVIQEEGENFRAGLSVLSRLSKAPLYVCTSPGTKLPLPNLENLCQAEFAGPHPAGLAGTHIHFLAPVTSDKVVWVIDYHHVIGVGTVFTTGHVPSTRVVALGGPLVSRPRLLRVLEGACVSEICENELLSAKPADPDVRMVCGSVLEGYEVENGRDFLGSFTYQVTALSNHCQQPILGWLRPGLNLFTVSRTLLSSLSGAKRKFSLACGQNGSPRSLIPLELYDRVFPLELLPVQMLKALLVRDTDTAQQLGCLELDEEDLALCSFVCPSKHEFGPVLRENLELIQREG